MKEIPLSNSPLVALVDDEDYPLLARITWSIDDGGYARNGNLRMHRLITGFQGQDTDHRDRNRLNNQKHNLRRATRQQNLMNRGKQRNGQKSPFKGVFFREGRLRKPWMANVTKKIDGKQKTFHIGYFSNPEAAARAYDLKARELYGDFAFQNFPATA